MKLPHEIKKNQLFLAMGLGCLVAVISGTLMYALGKNQAKPTTSQAAKASSIETATSHINPNDVWRIKLEEKMNEAQEKLDLNHKMMNEVMATLNPDKDEVAELRREIESLKESHQTAALHHSYDSVPTDSQSNGHVLSGSSPFSSSMVSATEGASVRKSGINKVIVALNKDKKQGLKKTTDNTIPAGTFVKATLLGGVDASTSIQSANDPRPVLLRLMDHGTLPRHLRSNVKDCHVLASAYGDLSSERVYMRLEKLSCTIPQTHEISEMTVSGYVAGEDGKAGLRGIVVDRSGPALRNSFMGGFFGGMGRFLTQTQQTYSYPLGNMTPFAQANPLTNDQMLKAGVGGGVGQALDKYADFYIKRAEQMQPVLQVAAGREVDVVFTQSTPIDETLFNNTVAKQNDQIRREKTLQQVSAENGSSMKEIVRQHEPLSR